MVAGEASQERRHGCGGSKLGAQTWSRAKRRDLSAPGGEKACGMRSASCRQVPDARVRDHVCAPSGGVAWAWRPWGVSVTVGEASQERRHGCGGSKLGAQTWSRAERRDLSALRGERAWHGLGFMQTGPGRTRPRPCLRSQRRRCGTWHPGRGVGRRHWGVSVTVGEQTRRADMVASEATQPVCSGEKKGHGAGSIPLGSQEVAPWTVFALSRPSELSAQCWVVFSHGTWKVDSGVSTLRALPKSHCCGCCTSPARTGLLCMYLTTFPRWRSSRIARS